MKNNVCSSKIEKECNSLKTMKKNVCCSKNEKLSLLFKKWKILFALKTMKKNVIVSKQWKKSLLFKEWKIKFSFKSKLLIKIVLDGYWKLSSGKKLEQKALTQRLHFQSNSSLQPLNSKTQTQSSKTQKKTQTQKNQTKNAETSFPE